MTSLFAYLRSKPGVGHGNGECDWDFFFFLFSVFLGGCQNSDYIPIELELFQAELKPYDAWCR